MAQASSEPGSLKTLWHIAAHRVKGDSHEERLESFYKGQASWYDSYRKKLLHGRKEMFSSLPVNDGDTWIDLGAGTGENAEHLKDKLPRFKQIYQVDLCKPLLEVASKRIEANNWTNVKPVHHDATTFIPPEGQVDLVTFSYSLTMIPDWFAAIDHAYNLLKPGGTLGVVDFYVSRKYPAEGMTKHSWSTRTFWSTFFAFDNVFLTGEHLPYITKKFKIEKLHEGRGKVPFMPFFRSPHYWIIAKKPA
jgi:S-adenosylmethionine-diacylgycerolhomoserine-N-methlytransferase